MEIFVDFGLFELMMGLGFVAAARALYSRKSVGIVVLATSVPVPLTFVVVVPEGLLKWLALMNLATGHLNAVVVLGAMKAEGVARTLAHLRLRQSINSMTEAFRIKAVTRDFSPAVYGTTRSGIT